MSAIIPKPFDDPIGHLEQCPGCHQCDALMNHWMACDQCGHWGEQESDGWFLGVINLEDAKRGLALVFCSEECRIKNGCLPIPEWFGLSSAAA